MMRGRPTWLGPERPAVPISAMVDAFARREDDLDKILGTAGPLARALPGYQDRPAQRQLAQMVYRCIEQRRHLVAEAGTGTGKSIGLVLPAYLQALKHDKKVVVATGTLVLQDQYRRDLEFLDEHLGPYFAERYGRRPTWSVFKGRSNFLCIEKDELPMGYDEEKAELARWDTETGDLNELSFDLAQEHYRPLRQALTADAEDCPGAQKCPSGEQCWYYRARTRASESDLVVVNHMILALDLLLDGQLLPPHDVVMVDEAHKFPGWVRNATEAKLSRGRVSYLARKCERLEMDVATLRAAGDALFDRIESIVAAKLERFEDDEPSIRVDGGDLAGPDLIMLSEALARVEADLALQSDPKAEAVARGISSFRNDLRSLTAENPGKILWAKGKRGHAPALYLTMVRVDGWLRETLLSRGTCIFSSATLANGPGEFSFFCGQIGLDACHKLQVASPFDYNKNLQYYLPTGISEDVLRPLPREKKYEQVQRHIDALEPHYRAILTATGGRALSLHTSRAMMLALAKRLSDLPFPMRIQGDAPKGALVAWLKETGGILFGLDSFWEGVDVPGPALSCVLIDKLPFTPPTDVVASAIKESYGEGRIGFGAYDLPMAIIRLKQACGRVNRNEDDRGLICLMDPRLLTKAYRYGILAALPGSPRAGETTLAGLDQVAAWLAARPRAPQTDEERHALQAVLTLAGLDQDGARVRNDVGFSAYDSDLGHKLAARLRCGKASDRQWEWAVRLAHKYRRQV